MNFKPNISKKQCIIPNILTSVHRFGAVLRKKQKSTTQRKKSLLLLRNLNAASFPESVMNNPAGEREVCRNDLDMNPAPPGFCSITHLQSRRTGCDVYFCNLYLSAKAIVAVCIDTGLLLKVILKLR